MYVAEKSAGQRSTYTFELGSLPYVAKNLQARNLRTGEKREHRWGGTWSPGKTDGGRWWERYLVRSLYVVDTVRTREVRTMAIGVSSVSLEGGGYCGGLHCRHAPVLRACGRTGDCSQATPHGVANTIVAILQSLGVLWPLSVPPNHHCVPFLIKRNGHSARYVRRF